MNEAPTSEKRVFQVYGRVTVSCYVKVDAMNQSEALEMARAGRVTESWEQDDDGEPEWISATEMKP